MQRVALSKTHPERVPYAVMQDANAIAKDDTHRASAHDSSARAHSLLCVDYARKRD